MDRHWQAAKIDRSIEFSDYSRQSVNADGCLTELEMIVLRRMVLAGRRRYLTGTHN